MMSYIVPSNNSDHDIFLVTIKLERGITVPSGCLSCRHVMCRRGGGRAGRCTPSHVHARTHNIRVPVAVHMLVQWCTVTVSGIKLVVAITLCQRKSCRMTFYYWYVVLFLFHNLATEQLVQSGELILMQSEFIKL